MLPVDKNPDWRLERDLGHGVTLRDPVVTIVLSFLGGLQLLSIGVLGEHLGRLFIEVKGRPLYVIESTYPPVPSLQPAVIKTD